MKIPVAKIRNAILIAGPTASGKSRLALEFAGREGGVIINADSMQVYGVLDVLTARPQAEELARAPHHLYGHVHPSVAYSTGAWLRDVATLADTGLFDRQRAIFVGGTGLYFEALLGGLSQIPEIPAPIREHWRNRLNEEGALAMYKMLAAVDPNVATKLKPADGQRIVRALEVIEASGKSISYWQAQPGTPLVDAESSTRLLIDIERQALIGRIDQRFDEMMAEGGLKEVQALLELQLAVDLPAMRAIGVKQLAAALSAEIELAEAVRLSKVATRQYAKRQETWFRNRFSGLSVKKST